MFVLIGVRDTVPVEPNAFHIPPHIAITDALNKKYANKLIAGKGLALSVYDITSAEDGKVTWGNGLMYYKTEFRLMLFAPFVGEVIVGRVKSCTSQYIRVSLGFFEDIYITRARLPPNSIYDPAEKRFFWWAGDDEAILSEAALFNTVKANRLYIDPNEAIRLRIDHIEWQPVKPTHNISTKRDAPPTANGINGDAPNGDAPVKSAEDEERERFDNVGYKIFADIGEAGLGVTGWWAGDDAAEEEMSDGMEYE